MAELIVVDDDRGLSGMLADYLGLAGHNVRIAESAPDLEHLMAAAPAELLILDVSLPGEDGFSIARRIRQNGDVGIIMLTGATEMVDRVVGLEIGADDYVTKPFSLAEMAARIDAILRRRRMNAAGMVPFGAFSLDLKRWALLDDRGERHGERPAELADRRRALAEPLHHGAPAGVRERLEDPVELVKHVLEYRGGRRKSQVVA